MRRRTSKALREAISLSDRARELDERITGCHCTFTALSGPGDAHDLLLTELGAIADASAIAADLDAAAARLGELESEQSELREEAGALRDQISFPLGCPCLRRYPGPRSRNGLTRAPAHTASRAT